MRRRLAAVLVTVALGTAACGSSEDGAGAGRGGSADAGLTGTLTVFAAASLTDVFTGLGQQLEQDNPELTVRFNFAGSSALATQLTQGAPADVFASANPAQMAVVTDAGLAEGEPTVFTANVLQIAVPAPASSSLPPQAAVPSATATSTVANRPCIRVSSPSRGPADPHLRDDNPRIPLVCGSRRAVRPRTRAPASCRRPEGRRPPAPVTSTGTTGVVSAVED